MIFQFAGDFFIDSTHHVGFHLNPFTDLLCIHGYHPTLYTVEPPLSGHLLLLRLELSIPYYNPHIRPQPGPDLPYQAPTLTISGPMYIKLGFR